jgi:hypothetical protein
MHFTLVELKANLVWQAQVVVDPETRPVEYVMVQFLMHPVVVEFQ